MATDLRAELERLLIYEAQQADRRIEHEEIARAGLKWLARPWPEPLPEREPDPGRSAGGRERWVDEGPEREKEAT